MNFPWGNHQRYYSYSNYIRKFFSGRTQKLSIDAGFTCPNRDGTKGVGGCLYCNNASFKPDYCQPELSVTQQLKRGMTFFSKNKKPDQFLAYFQAYSNTYDRVDRLEQLFLEALHVEGVVGLVISTRADCLEGEKLDLLKEISQKHYVSIEIGIESCNEETLRFLNRCCSFKEVQETVQRISQKGIQIGAHLILGLPGEDEATILTHADKISQLPVNTLKIHQLQIIRNTQLAQLYKKHPDSFNVLTLGEYINLLMKFLEVLNPAIAVERFSSQSPKDLLIQPMWGMKNYEITRILDAKLKTENTWQGRNFQSRN